METSKRERGTGDAGRCVKQRSKQQYKKKRRYHGKGKTKTNENQENVLPENFDEPSIISISTEVESVVSSAEAVIISEATPEALSISQVIDIDEYENQENILSDNVDDASIISITTEVESVVSSAEPEIIPEATPEALSISKVLDIIDENIPAIAEDAISGFRLIDMSILASVFISVACPECLSTKALQLFDVNEKKKGLARLIIVQCKFCPYTMDFYTSKQVEQPPTEDVQKKKGGGKYMEVNLRTVYGMRAIGAGHSMLEKLCCHLDMPHPMTSCNYDNISNNIKNAVKDVAEKSMADAAKELRSGKETADIGVSVDGTWQRKGFTSTLGVVTAISVDTGKVLDSVILSKSCKGCTSMEKFRKSDPKRFEQWKTNHKCNLNYQGSSPNMEKVGAVKIFERSVEKHRLYYTAYYGDGDSKSYASVKNIYAPLKTMPKYECIGHYQKRVGCRLRKLRKDKNLGGRNGLTTTKIDTLQNYFGIALRNNVGDLEKMTEAIMASLYHVSEYHEKCPKTPTTWCLYQRDKLDGTNFYKVKKGLPTNIRKAIMPIYIDLCKPEILSKCLHGKTQNANESFNAMVWNRIPKAYHVGLNKLTLGVYDAIAHFNYGEKATLDVLKSLNVVPGVYTTRTCDTINRERKRSAAYHMTEVAKKRRKIIRHDTSKKQDNYIVTEGTSYESGGCGVVF